MIAQVYPLIRLPRRFTFFDYQIPSSMKVNAGDLVKIKFKNREIFGVVRCCASSSKIEKLQPIEELVLLKFMTAGDIERFEIIARNIVQSPATVIHAALGAIKNKSGQIDLIESSVQLNVDLNLAQQIQNAVKVIETESRVFVQTSPEGEYALASTLRRKFDGQMLIICPRERSAELMAKNLNLGSKTALLHGHTTRAAREAIILAWARGQIQTLIGTRQASLLPAQNLKLVLITDVSSEDYRMLDKNPRVDARNAAELLARQHQAKFITTGFLPRLSATSMSKNIFLTIQDCLLVDMKHQLEQSVSPLLSKSLFDAARESLQNEKSVLISFNRKGVANHLQCGLCGHIPLCATCGNVPTPRLEDLICSVCGMEMWIPKQCPACGSEKLKARGLGNKQLQKQLQELFPNAKIGIVDKTQQDVSADILIVTEYYFKNIWQPFEPKQFGLVAELNLDLSMVGADFRGTEIAAYKLHRLMSIAKQQKAVCIVQTYLADIVKPMLQTELFVENELKMRSQYSLPPAFSLAKITCPDSAQTKNQILKDKNIDLQNLKKTPDSCIIEIDTPSYE